MLRTLTAICAAALLFVGCSGKAHAAGNDKVLPTYQQTAPGQSWSGSIYYDIASKELSAIVATKVKDLTVHGKSTGFEIDGFTGAVFMRDGKNTTGNSKAVLGAGLVYRKELFDNVSAFVGVGVSIAGGRPAGAGVMAGLGVKF